MQLDLFFFEGNLLNVIYKVNDLLKHITAKKASV